MVSSLIIMLAIIAAVSVTQRTDGRVYAAAKKGSVSSFGRPMREGPGFPVPHEAEEDSAGDVKPEAKPSPPKSDEPVSAFGRPLRPGPGR